MYLGVASHPRRLCASPSVGAASGDFAVRRCISFFYLIKTKRERGLRHQIERQLLVDLPPR